MYIPRRNEHCPHCGLYTTHRLVFMYRRWDAIPASFGTDLKQRIESLTDCDGGFWYPSFYLAVCESCFEPSLYCAEPPLDRETDSFEFSVDRIWPMKDIIGASVPDDVARYLDEARRVRRQSLNSYLVNVRKALEAICDDKAVPKGPLATRLKQLAFANTIPPVIQEMTDVLRFLGNVGAHSGRDISGEEADAATRLLRWVIEYVYIAPLELKRVRQVIAKLAASSLKDTEETSAELGKGETVQ